MADAYKNFAVSAVATAPSPAGSGTSLVVAAGQGARFPVPPFNATVWPAGVLPDPTNAEIVRVTAIATDTLTILRAQEGTSARTMVVGDLVAATITKKLLDELVGGSAPAAHHTSHQAGGTDAIPLDTLAPPTDVTTLNASAAAHGLLRKLSGVTTDVLKGDGTWSAVSAGAPAAHAPTHASGGSDAVTLAVSQVSPVTGPSVVGRTTGTGPGETLPLGAGLAVTGGSLTATTKASGVFDYVFNSAAFVAPPNSQRIRFNAGSPYTGVTTVWADFDSANSEDLYWGWMRITVGSYLMVQDKDNHDQYAEFIVTSAPVDSGTYVTLGVTHKAHGGTALATQAVLVRVTTVSGGGPPAAHHASHETGGSDAIVALSAAVLTSGTVPDARFPATLPAASGANLTTLNASNLSSGTVPSARLPARTGALSLVIDGGGSAITTGVKGDVYIPFACTITASTLIADQTGSVVLDLKVSASYATTPTVSIVASAPPTLSSAAAAQDVTLTGWTVSVAAGSRLRYSVTSVSTITRLTHTLTVTVP